MYSGMEPRQISPQMTPYQVADAPQMTTMGAPQMPPQMPPQPMGAPKMPQLPQQANPMAQQQMMARQLRGQIAPGMGAPQMPTATLGNPMQPQRGGMGQPQMSAGASIARR